MPVTKTAKRALRASRRKKEINKQILTRLEVATRMAKKIRIKDKILRAISLTDKAVKKRVIHKNKGSRIKAGLSKLLVKERAVKSSTKKTPKKKRS